ncbi:MAG: aminotransferase class I/II-fold pyridoxal phosphate-dependent enzyme [Gammaproteobacteria bacterium]|nr:aminotransferase class I/II-fold pyridoxal phosphate-dependent enzyme [Gammaproteobacteria bacterium]
MNRTKKQSPDFLPYGRQLVDEDDIAAVNEVLRSDWLTAGPATEAFEKAITEATGARYAIACSSGTAALHLISVALGLRQNDVAVVPAITFLATANSPHLAGADIVFTDVDPDTGLMTAETFRQAIKKHPPDRIKVVFAVHLNGQAAPLEELSAVAKEHGIAIVEDGCHALGSTYRTADGSQNKVGDCRYSAATAFSFHPVKTIAMGEGGAVTTNDTDLAQRVRSLRNHGMERDPATFSYPDQGLDRSGSPNPWYYEMHSPGFNYRASDIHCALGLSQLSKLSLFSERRRQLMKLYNEELAGLTPAVMPVHRVGILLIPYCTCIPY